MVKLREMQDKTYEALFERAIKGDNEAARVLLEALDKVAVKISKWQQRKNKLTKEETE